MIISLDTETTGTDTRHAARPFFVTTCDESAEQRWWEWDVDPITRMPEIPDGDLDAIWQLVCDADELVLQNAKFDVAALGSLDRRFRDAFPWEKTHDTLLAAHLLASSQPKDLTSLAIQYLGVDIQHFEDALETACNQARTRARRAFPEWQIAKQGLAGMPSAKGKCWKYDTWLPRQLAEALAVDPEDSWGYWYTVTREYANADSAVTLPLWSVLRRLLKSRGLWKLYVERAKLPGIIYGMEKRGVTVSKSRLDAMHAEFQEESDRCKSVCVTIAADRGHDLQLPQGSTVNGSLHTFVFDNLQLEAVARTKLLSKPALNAQAVAVYLVTLPAATKPGMFIRSLARKRKFDTALTFIKSYERYGVPLADDWLRLFPSFNPTTTNTLRFSSNNPNGQNASKQELANLRYCFGPAPGREWWCLDYENIERRIPAYEAGEEAIIELFEHPEQPPYYGSEHLLVAHVLHPKLWADLEREVGFDKMGPLFKERYKATWYQRVKNGNFAVQYGAQDREDGNGTADRAYGVPGAQSRIAARFLKTAELNRKYISFANRHGYVETLPDKTVDARRGYPLMCVRTERGAVKPTVPFAYHVSGTAMWCTCKAMTRCDAYLRSLPIDAYMPLQVHDELVFDFPCGGGAEPWRSNLRYIQRIAELMAQSGQDIGVPLRVSVSYHAETWAKGVQVDADNLNPGEASTVPMARFGVVLGGGQGTSGGRLPVLRQGRQIFSREKHRQVEVLEMSRRQ